MEDNEIIKALEHCVRDVSAESCNGCPMNNGECDRDMNAVEKYALDLINRQKAEIERLKSDLEFYQRATHNLNKELTEGEIKNDKM